jgi:hypothetical protein
MSIITRKHRNNVEKLCRIMDKAGEDLFDMRSELQLDDYSKTNSAESLLANYVFGDGPRPENPVELLHDCGAACCLAGWEDLVFGKYVPRFSSFGISCSDELPAEPRKYHLRVFIGAVNHMLYAGRGPIWAHVVGGPEELNKLTTGSLTLEQGKRALRLSVLVVQSAERGLVSGDLGGPDLYDQDNHLNSHYSTKLMQLITKCDRRLTTDGGVLVKTREPRVGL